MVADRTVFVLDLFVAGALLLAIDRLEAGSIDWFGGIALPILALLALLFLLSVWAVTRVRGVVKPAVVLAAVGVLCTGIDIAIRWHTESSPTPTWSLIVLVSVVPAVLFLLLLQRTVLRHIDLRRRFDL